jgi:hypothetical protein
MSLIAGIAEVIIILAWLDPSSDEASRFDGMALIFNLLYIPYSAMREKFESLGLMHLRQC